MCHERGLEFGSELGLGIEFFKKDEEDQEMMMKNLRNLCWFV